MEENTAVKGIAPEMLSTYRLLKCTFPDGIEPEAYYPLLALLYEGIAYRGLAEIMSLYTGKEWARVYNDILGATSSNSELAPSPEAIAKVKERLIPCGYEEWLREEE